MATFDAGIVNQLKKGRSETNDRLDKLIDEQLRTNQLLQWLGGVIQAASTSN